MNTIREQIEIEWPLRALFHYMADITNNAEWQRDVTQAKWIERTPEQVGSLFSEIKIISGEETEVINTVVEFIPYQRRSIARRGCVFSLQFVPLSDESTRVIFNMEQLGRGEEGESWLMPDLVLLKNKLELVCC